MLLAALDQVPSLRGDVQSHHPVVLRISLPAQQTLPLEPLRKARDARGIDLEPVANLPLAYPVLLDDHAQEEPRRCAQANLTLEGVLHPPEGEPQKRHQRTVVCRLLRQHLILLLRTSVLQHLVDPPSLIDSASILAKLVVSTKICLAHPGPVRGVLSQCRRCVREGPALKKPRKEGATQHGFRSLCPGRLTGQFGLERGTSASQHAGVGPARRPARLRTVLVGRAS